MMRQVGVYTRAVALVLCVSVPPVVALGVGLVNQNQHALRLDADYHHLLLAERARADVGHSFDAALHAMERVGEAIQPGSPSKSEQETLSELARRLGEAQKYFSFVSIYGPDGHRRGTVRPRGADGGEGPQQLAPELLGESFRIGAVTDQAVPVILPVGADTERMWVYAQLELTELTRLVTSLGMRPPLRDSGGVALVDGSRHVVAGQFRGQLEPMFQALEGDMRFDGRDLSIATEFSEGGRPMLGALATMPALGWAVVVKRPLDQAYESLGSLRLAVAGAVLVAILAAILATLVGARWLTTPVRLLTESTQALAERRFSAVDERVLRRTDEIGVLGRSFGEMAERLAQSEQTMLEEARVRGALSRFLAPALVERLIGEPDALALGGHMRTVTVMFADVAGFSRLAESLPPQTVMALLNELFTFATEIVHRRGGMIDKFIGDAVMAVWGVPEEKADDTQQALDAAEELRRWVETGNRRWQQKWGVEIQLGIGIHSGKVIAGNMGSPRRMDYTVIGDAVNVAARLEAEAAPGQILISSATRERLSNIETVNLRPVGVRVLGGRSETTEVFEVAL